MTPNTGFAGRSYVQVEIDPERQKVKAKIIGKSFGYGKVNWYHLLISKIENGMEVGTEKLWEIEPDRVTAL